MKMGRFVGWSTLALAMLPAWAVKSATEQGRLGWVITALLLGFAGLIGGLIAKAAPLAQPSPANIDATRYRPILGTTLYVCTIAAILLSIAFTYAEPDKGALGNLASLVSYVGSWLFPVVARYATDLQPPLSPERLFQVQSVVSTVLLAGLLAVGAYVVCWFLLSPADRRHLLENGPRDRPRGLVEFGAVSFSLFVGASAYFGWSEFEPIADIGKFCIIKATCYAHGDDLLILAAAGMKLVAIVVFPLGALAIVLANRVSADPGTEP